MDELSLPIKAVNTPSISSDNKGADEGSGQKLETFLHPTENEEEQLPAEEAPEEDDGDEDEDEELSGCDPHVPYYPFPLLEGILSKRFQRLSAIQKWLPIDATDGSSQLAVQSPNAQDPLALPVLAKFTFKCVRQTEAEMDNNLFVIILGYDEVGNGFYSIYFEGARTLDHLANVGSDDCVYPYGTLSSVAKVLYGKNCNGWKSLEVYSPDTPHNGKSLSQLRPAEGGPGFRNTLSPDLLEEWSNLGQRKLNKESNYQLEVFRHAVIQTKNRVLAGDEKESEQDEEDDIEEDDIEEDDIPSSLKVTAKAPRKTAKTAKAPSKTAKTAKTPGKTAKTAKAPCKTAKVSGASDDSADYYSDDEYAESWDSLAKKKWAQKGHLSILGKKRPRSNAWQYDDEDEEGDKKVRFDDDGVIIE
jgi:hypothetical protein